MYGFNSHRSATALSAPVDKAYSRIRTYDASCAFPSWPRRSSLSDPEQGEETRATAYLSDDLFLSDPFDDDTRSVSSNGDTPSPFIPAVESPPHISEEEMLRMERARAAMQREFVRQLKQEKERRRQAALQARRGSPRKSPKHRTACLSTIAEGSEREAAP